MFTSEVLSLGDRADIDRMSDPMYVQNTELLQSAMAELPSNDTMPPSYPDTYDKELRELIDAVDAE
jgi:hypothetical protein